MRIVVCVKQVPSTTNVKLDPVTNTIVRDGRQSIINPFDSFAIEQAVQLGQAHGAETVALSMGIPETRRLLRDAVARGVTRGVLLSDKAFAGADTLATAYTLSLGIRHIGGADLVICGKMAVDGDTAQIGPELAEFLGIPHVTGVYKIEEMDKRGLRLWRKTDNSLQKLYVPLPALITVEKDINMPRMPSIAGVRLSCQTPHTLYDVDDLQADAQRTGLNGSPTQVVQTYTPERRTKAVKIRGDAAGQAKELCAVIATHLAKEEP